MWGNDPVWDLTTNPTGQYDATHHPDPLGGGAPQTITLNVWHDIVIHVLWTGGQLVELWVDGVLYTRVISNVDFTQGPGQYLKFGMNRWGPNGPPVGTWVIYYDDLRIGDAQATYADVAP
jgi:hypothetical protein